MLLAPVGVVHLNCFSGVSLPAVEAWQTGSDFSSWRSMVPNTAFFCLGIEINSLGFPSRMPLMSSRT